jgi:hypothetical protein
MTKDETGGGKGDATFGDPEDFAIEVGTEPDLSPPTSVWGHMRVWCGGVPLGNLQDRHCALYPAYGKFRSLPGRVDRLWDDGFAGRSDRELWDFLYGALYGLKGDWDRYNTFEFLTHWGEQFDDYPAFLLSPPGGRCRVLFQARPNGEPAGVDVSRAGLVTASAGFVAWFEQEARRLCGESA